MNNEIEPLAHAKKKASPSCYHCGQLCDESALEHNGKMFCCYGCQTVYSILDDNNLCEYYSLDQSPGKKQATIDRNAFAYLDESDIQKKILTFYSSTFAKTELFIPAIHCISCLWLLENLAKLCYGVLRVQVNFARKRATIEYDPRQVALSTIAATLASVGYAPQISLEQTPTRKNTHPLIAKLSVAGFVFGNIMLLSFPEYLGLDGTENELKRLFSYLNIFLSIPVLVFSAQDYFKNTWTSLRQKQINIDVPIALGLGALFCRSLYDVLTGSGPGYLDSFSGLVFFLLIGRWFQDRTYDSLAFDRDYKSYFPLAIQKLSSAAWKPVLVHELNPGDLIKVRNLEVVPADARLHSKEAFIDYSFVTGEARPVHVRAGETIYAGGRLIGEPVVLEVEKKISQSELTSLWNNAVFQKPKESRYKRIIDVAARGFTWFVLAFAIATAVYWQYADPSRMWLILTSVLIVACPCALALAAPFTYGSMLRVFGNHGLYLKNADIIERLATINAVVFDKTGTITTGTSSVSFTGTLNAYESTLVKSLAVTSAHPLSMALAKSIKPQHTFPVNNLTEYAGKGIRGEVDGHLIKIGSSVFVGAIQPPDHTASHVFVSINAEVRGYFTLTTNVRSNLKSMLEKMKLPVALLSGDNESDRKRMKSVFPPGSIFRFHQSPQDKMEFIKNWNAEGRNVLMLGDGLNDSGALKQSDVGLAITDDTGTFTPACDGILQGDQLQRLNTFLYLAKASTRILKASFSLSFFYNFISLGFAVTGNLTPLVAAILMPISSVSVVGFSTLAVTVVARITLRKAL